MPLEAPRTLEVVDTHYGGDMSRIVLGGVKPLPGSTALEKQTYLEREADGLRRLLLYPPHGDPSMCANLIVETEMEGAEAGYIIMEAMGYPPYSGSNSICTVTALLESGRIPMEDGTRSVTLEAPIGRVTARAECRGGRALSVAVEGQPAYVAARGRSVDLPGRGRVSYDLVWSGCFYMVVEAEPLGFSLEANEIPALTEVAGALIEAARLEEPSLHPILGEVGPLAFLHFAGPLQELGPGRWRSPSATYVHPGVLCSCPTGTGTSARLALMAAEGRAAEGGELTTVSPRGSSMVGTVLGEARVGEHRALRSEIAGRAFTLARSQFVVDPADPLIDPDSLALL